MEDIERIKERLDNIRSVEPIIASLRTIAAGGWRQALRHSAAAQAYVDQLSQVLAALFVRMPPRSMSHPALRRTQTPFRKVLMVVISSERGLCGGFNHTVLEGAERLIAQQQLESDEVVIGTLGSRGTQYFGRRKQGLYLAHPLPVTRLASLESVHEIADNLLGAFQRHEVDAVFIVYSPYKSAVTQTPVSERWLPIDPSLLPTRSSAWPEPLIGTDAEAILETCLDEWVYSRIYQFVIESAASEQSARFRAMENATQNLQRFIEELTLSYHTARQHAITMEMLDLVGGSGVLRNPDTV